jgi:AraC family transcriptional regulator of adaptative response/methylated-DNA-[protein]-cysteine methyltransferase
MHAMSGRQSRNPGERVLTTRLLTPLGPMIAGATDEGVCLLEFADRRMLETRFRRLSRRYDAAFVPGSNEILDRLDRELREYFEGRLQEFRVPLSIRGTGFQRLAWESLLQIPYGETRSYEQQARAMGRPDAVRAVGSANGDNRIAVVIPCHRVVGSDGRLTGYGGGLWRKKALLELEQGASGTFPGRLSFD